MAAGLLSYNAILCALALGGVFFAFSLRSLAIGVAAAWVSAILGQLLAALLAPLGLPALTLSFCLVTAAVMMLVRHRLPALIPVSMHAIHSPQEHRRRYAVAVGLLRDFRRNLQAGLSLGGVRRQSLKARADASVVQELDALFARLDRDGDGRLSRVDLAGGLRAFEPVADQTDPWSDAVAAAERRLDMLESIERLLHVLAPESDDQIDATQFAELMLRCRRLLRDRDRLLTYLQPISADPTRPIGRSELDRLLVSLGQSPLEDQEWTAVVRLTGGRLLTWGAVVDLMLIT
jgi:Ca2+-binding EF-hand superfamily protein